MSVQGKRALVVLLAAAAAAGGCGEGGERPPSNAASPAPPAGAPPQANAAAPAAPAPAPATPTEPLSPSGYALVGTEPFWGGTVTGTSIRYMTPDRQFGDVVETRRSYGPGTETYTGAFRGRPFVLTLSRGPCSDGMSDRSYAFAATLQVLGETRRGCADPEGEPPAP